MTIGAASAPRSARGAASRCRSRPRAGRVPRSSARRGDAPAVTAERDEDRPSAEAGKKRVSLYLQNVRPLVAVAAVTPGQRPRLPRDSETGIVRIFTTRKSPSATSRASGRTDQGLHAAYPNAFDAAQAIADLFGDRVECSFGVDSGRAVRRHPTGSRLDRFDLIDSRSHGLGYSRAEAASAGAAGWRRFRVGGSADGHRRRWPRRIGVGGYAAGAAASA